MRATFAPPAAFLFDMDGLLLDTERLFLQSFVELTSELKISQNAAETFFVSIVGTSARDTAIRLRTFLPAEVDAEQFEDRWRQMHSDRVEKDVPVKAHAVEVLRSIQELDVPMAVVTSTFGTPARHHLEHAGLLSYFETVCAGDEVTANKPDPAPYLTGAARLRVSATDCVAFEDSDLGTTAAVRAGCKTVQIPDLRPVDKPLPDLGQLIARDLGHAAVQIGLFDKALT